MIDSLYLYFNSAFPIHYYVLGQRPMQIIIGRYYLQPSVKYTSS